MNVSWSILPFEELPVRDLHAVLKLRVDVFVVEQTCPYAEVDGQDPQSVPMAFRTSAVWWCIPITAVATLDAP